MTIPIVCLRDRSDGDKKKKDNRIKESKKMRMEKRLKKKKSQIMWWRRQRIQRKLVDSRETESRRPQTDHDRHDW